MHRTPQPAVPPDVHLFTPAATACCCRVCPLRLPLLAFLPLPPCDMLAAHHFERPRPDAFSPRYRFCPDLSIFRRPRVADKSFSFFFRPAMPSAPCWLSTPRCVRRGSACSHARTAKRGARRRASSSAGEKTEVRAVAFPMPRDGADAQICRYLLC